MLCLNVKLMCHSHHRSSQTETESVYFVKLITSPNKVFKTFMEETEVQLKFPLKMHFV